MFTFKATEIKMLNVYSRLPGMDTCNDLSILFRCYKTLLFSQTHRM